MSDKSIILQLSQSYINKDLISSYVEYGQSCIFNLLDKLKSKITFWSHKIADERVKVCSDYESLNDKFPCLLNIKDRPCNNIPCSDCRGHLVICKNCKYPKDYHNSKIKLSFSKEIDQKPIICTKLSGEILYAKLFIISEFELPLVIFKLSCEKWKLFYPNVFGINQEMEINDSKFLLKDIENHLYKRKLTSEELRDYYETICTWMKLEYISYSDGNLIYNINNINECLICFNNIPELILHPCKHLVICNVCHDKIKDIGKYQCPKCFVDILYVLPK